MNLRWFQPRRRLPSMPGEGPIRAAMKSLALLPGGAICGALDE